MGSSFEFLMKHIGESWRLIREVPSAAAVLIFLGVIAGLLWDRRRISILNERLKSKDDQLGQYKEKLQGATPEEVRAAIEALKRHLEAQEARLNEYKEKLSGASPDEIKARIDHLEKKLQETTGLVHAGLGGSL